MFKLVNVQNISNLFKLYCMHSNLFCKKMEQAINWEKQMNKLSKDMEKKYTVISISALGGAKICIEHI